MSLSGSMNPPTPAQTLTALGRNALGGTLPTGYVPMTSARFTGINATGTNDVYSSMVEKQVVQTMDPVVCITFHGFYATSGVGEAPMAWSYDWIGAEAKIIDAAGADVTTWKTVRAGSVRGYKTGEISAASAAGATGNVTVNPGTFEHFFVDFGVCPTAGQKLLIRYSLRVSGSNTLFYSRDAWSTREGYHTAATTAVMFNTSLAAATTGYIVQEPIISGIPIAGTAKNIAIFGTSIDIGEYRWDVDGPHLWSWWGQAFGAEHNVLCIANSGSLVATDIGTTTGIFNACKVRMDLARDCGTWIYGNPFTNDIANNVTSAGTRTSVVDALKVSIALWVAQAELYGKEWFIGNAIPVGITTTDDFLTVANQTVGNAHKAGAVTDLNTWLLATYGDSHICDQYTAVADVATGKFRAPTVPVTTGTATAGVTATSLVDSSKFTASTPQQVWKNYLIRYTSGAANGLTKKASTSYTTTVTHATFGATVPVAGDTYDILAPYATDTVNHPGPGGIVAMGTAWALKL